MNIQLAKPEHIDAWMALVEQVRDAFPGLETAEAMAEHRATVLKFMQSSSAIWAVDAGRVIGTLLFSPYVDKKLTFLGTRFKQESVKQIVNSVI